MPPAPEALPVDLGASQEAFDEMEITVPLLAPRLGEVLELSLLNLPQQHRNPSGGGHLFQNVFMSLLSCHQRVMEIRDFLYPFA